MSAQSSILCSFIFDFAHKLVIITKWLIIRQSIDNFELHRWLLIMILLFSIWLTKRSTIIQRCRKPERTHLIVILITILPEQYYVLAYSVIYNAVRLIIIFVAGPGTPLSSFLEGAISWKNEWMNACNTVIWILPEHVLQVVYTSTIKFKPTTVSVTTTNFSSTWLQLI